MTNEFEVPHPEIPGWDWKPEDYSWLSSQSGLYKDGVSIFFIHGGHIRHQAHIEHGWYDLDIFIKLLQNKAAGLENVQVVWHDGSSDSDPDLWVEGTRLPNEEDLARLQSAREHKLWQDKLSYMELRKTHPKWFSVDVELDQHGRPV